MRSLRGMGHRYQQGPAVSIVRTDTCSILNCVVNCARSCPVETEHHGNRTLRACRQRQFSFEWRAVRRGKANE